MSKPIIFGEIEGIDEGYHFNNRREMMPTSFHRNWAAGIDGNSNEGTSAIVLSGGYEDDLDFGEEIVYTGAGGNDSNTGKQVKDQVWEKGNAGLIISMDQGLPVRVIRGSTHKSEFSPKEGYLYAGLYSVVDAWEEIGKSGFKICRFRLEYSGNNKSKKTIHQIELDYSKRIKRTVESTVLRIVRDTKVAWQIKKLYNFKCQVCQITIPTKLGHYAEGAHIRPLGKPHIGDDNPDNVICLCPNHHIMFDKGVFSIADNFQLIGCLSGRLTIHNNHKLNISNLKYHRQIHGFE
ncbi:MULTISPECIES: YDG/SRA domain-containing protein [unclassified Chryseobacterium]|uniref:YDG/SRA domain-containing protein n=1 Tax=unclassified Chryseobacterium TaxID=2593645 RepID=UPI000D9693D2|nr:MULTISPECIES: YDG/SRA domain-containing protein [unclassified Chryseobacterium]PXW18037.1 putative restriction endonuclease [Chryseobacterium sp. CBTAP 102]